MEPRLGHDFSRVRVHSDSRAAESAAAVTALAYTVGRDIVFGIGQFRPESITGQKLIAHELTHIMQQHVPAALSNTTLTIGSPDSVYEEQADQISNSIGGRGTAAGRARRGVISDQRLPAVIQRQGTPPARQPPFDDEPTDLRQVIEASFAAGKFGCAKGNNAADCYNRLDSGARLVLKSLYNRLYKYGLWSHVLNTWGIWTSDAGGAQFIVKDGAKFFSALVADSNFCLDTAAGGLLHKGATSVREISSGDSLHLSLGSANTFSAHIDKISPAMGREASFRCRYDPTAAAAHIGREVVPLAIPGLQVFPEPRPSYGLPDRGEPPPEIIRLELLRF